MLKADTQPTGMVGGKTGFCHKAIKFTELREGKGASKPVGLLIGESAKIGDHTFYIRHEVLHSTCMQ